MSKLKYLILIVVCALDFIIQKNTCLESKVSIKGGIAKLRGNLRTTGKFNTDNNHETTL